MPDVSARAVTLDAAGLVVGADDFDAALADYKGSRDLRQADADAEMRSFASLLQQACGGAAVSSVNDVE